MRKQAEGKSTLLMCLSVSHVSCLLASLLDKACSKITASFFTVDLLSLATVIPQNNVNKKNCLNLMMNRGDKIENKL